MKLFIQPSVYLDTYSWCLSSSSRRRTSGEMRTARCKGWRRWRMLVSASASASPVLARARAAVTATITTSFSRWNTGANREMEDTVRIITVISSWIVVDKQII